MNESSAARHERKAIVLFSDGTGNSAAKLYKTNVWRLYRALDLAEPSVEQVLRGELRQIALYDDGVGTSAFRPLALLGGAFGYGLRRNVLDLYKFLSRNYRDGDRIYAFGFSRGAFTIRVLMGLVLRVGLLDCEDEACLQRDAGAAYRRYRRNFKARNLAGAWRWLRDCAIDLWRSRSGRVETLKLRSVPEIEFVGVWDTVAAYGMPIAEMTRAVDQWIWPTSMPNYVLSPKVKQARHALALDDERDTFRPLLWDEIEEDKNIPPAPGRPRRMQQVWFAGMHSDVGGGYPDDSLAHVSLDWMMGEAAACGLRFKAGAREQVAQEKNALGPMHDSRSGFGSYYRYQPRRLSARCEPPDPQTLLMQDPDRAAAQGRLRGVVVHKTVLERIRAGPDGYATIVLPPCFAIWNEEGGTMQQVAITGDTDPVWADVWRRRGTYFLSLLLTAGLLAPLLLPASACEGKLCLFSPAIELLANFVPDLALPLVHAWAAYPGTLTALLIGLSITWQRSRYLQRRIDDEMSAVWRASLGPIPEAARALRAPGASRRMADAIITTLRKSRAYQRTIQWLKWRAAPAVFAALFLCGAIAAVFMLAAHWAAL